MHHMSRLVHRLRSPAAAAAPGHISRHSPPHCRPRPLAAPTASTPPTPITPTTIFSPRSTFLSHHQFSFNRHQSRFNSPKSPTMAPVPPTMKAVSFARPGDVSVLDLTTVPVPAIGPDEVLIRNTYAGVNFIDTYFRSGQYPIANLPMILGQEAAGTVVQVGAEADPKFEVGTQVVYMPAAGAGTYCEYTKVHASRVIRIPDGVDMDKAVAVYLQGLTAWTFIKRAAAVQEGEWTLVHAAAGGVGSLLVQLLKIVGAKVIATASSEEKLKIATELGADYTVNSNDDVVKRVDEITGGHGVDSIFDGVGKATFEVDLKMIALGGNLVMLGNSSGNVEPFDIRSTLGPKNIRLTRPILFGYTADRAALEKYSAELFGIVASGKIKVLQHGVYDLANAAQAHTDIASRKTIGKLLIKIN